MKTIALSEDLHRELLSLKMQEKDRNVAELIRKLVSSYREKKFLENSQKFRAMLKRDGVSFEQFFKNSKDALNT